MGTKTFIVTTTELLGWLGAFNLMVYPIDLEVHCRKCDVWGPKTYWRNPIGIVVCPKCGSYYNVFDWSSI